jgi:hypothetical protein
MVVMKHTYIRSAILGLGICLATVASFAQTFPTAVDLSLGNYTMTNWPNASAAGTYPTGMIFHTFVDRIEPFAGAYDLAPNGNWALAYNLTSGPRINGRDASGIEFTQTATAQAGNCSFVGAAILAVNTLNRAGVTASFVARTVSVQTRPYVIRLQWRIGSAGAWTDAIGANGGRVEHRSFDNSTNSVTYNFMFPTALENQSVVQLRWLYFQDGDGSGNRPSMQLDDIAVNSTPIAGTPTHLWVTQVSPQSPTVNIPFSVLVRSTDAAGAPKNVAVATTIQLAKTTGAGFMSGTLAATIPAGASSVLFTNVVHNTAELMSFTASTTAGMVLVPFTQAVTVTQPSYAVITGAPVTAYTNAANIPFKVTVYKADNTIDVNYNQPITLTKVVGGGTLSGTLTVTAMRGEAIFSNYLLNTAGSVTLQVTIPGLSNQTLPITVITAPTLTTNNVPQYVSARTPSGTCAWNAFPIPSYALVTFNGLQPNTTYRYNTGGIETTAALTSTGGGFNVHYDANTNTYSYSSSKSLMDAGAYSTFSTGNGQTTKQLWVNLVPTNANAFADLAVVQWRVALGEANGRIINYYALSLTSTALDMGSVSTMSTLLGERTSDMPAKNFVVTYDNTAGTGRPIGISIVQSHNTVVTGTTTRYTSDIQNVAGAWMIQVPNTLTLGVRRIELRSSTNNALLYAVNSTNGVWGGINTYPGDLVQYPAGPGGFNTPIYIETPRITISSPKTGDTLCSGRTYPIVFRAEGETSVKIEYSSNNGLSWEMIEPAAPLAGGISVANNGTYNWYVPGVGLTPTTFTIRITGNTRTDVNGLSNTFTVVEPLAIVQDLTSKNLCLDDTDTLIVITSGSIRGYQWYKDGVPIPATNSPVYYLTDVHYNTSGVYTCKVLGYGGCGDVTTGPSHVRVSRKTTIVNQSFAVPGIIGQTAHLWVEAEVPDDAISYQWYRGQTMLTDDGHYFGTSSNHMEIRNFAIADYGNDYYCIVVGVCQSAQSRVVRVFPTGVYAEFKNTTISACDAGTVVLAADVYSNPPGEELEVRWYYNGNMLVDGAKYSGAQTSTLTINNVTGADAGDYVVKAVLVLDPNAMSEATATVIIATPPSITGQPGDATICEGQNGTLTVAASATGAITYQWYKDGVAIQGETNADLVIASMTAAREGAYACVVATACGSLTSDTADVTMKPATVIVTNVVTTHDLNINSTLTLTVDATGSGTVQYQWFKDGTELTGEVAPTYTRLITSADDAGKYWCRIQAECGELTSDTATVTVDATTGVDDLLVGSAVVSHVMPNPANSVAYISVTLPSAQSISMNVVDASGVVVFQVMSATLDAGTYNFPVNLNEVPSGMYMLQTVINGNRNQQMISVVR